MFGYNFVFQITASHVLWLSAVRGVNDSTLDHSAINNTIDIYTKKYFTQFDK